MANKRWRTWLGWGVFGLALVGIGFAIEASLPAQPRFVLRGTRTEGIMTGMEAADGATIPGALSADGTILTTRSYLRGPDGEVPQWQAFTSWDTVRGVERGEFFRGLIGAQEVRGRDDLANTGFDMSHLTYSPDRRFCALMHRDGLALADLQTGQEWKRVVEWKSADYSPDSVAVHRMLLQAIDTKSLQEKIPLRDALKKLCAGVGGPLKIVVDHEALASEADEDAVDPCGEEACLPPVPSKMAAEVALRLLISQVARGNADYRIRGDVVEITTAKRVRQNAVERPMFSPRGSFVTLAEAGKNTCRLHIVECASGRPHATPSIDPETFDFAFTPDEELLFFWQRQDSRSVFAVWDTRNKKVARTFPAVRGRGSLAPDGETLLACDDDGEWQLVNLRNGQIRRLPGLKGVLGEWRMSPDGQTLVCAGGQELALWDMPTGKQRGRIELGRFWPNPDASVFFSADSRVVCLASDTVAPQFKAWNLATGERLWPPLVPDPDDLIFDQNGEIIEVFKGGGLRSKADMSPKFTPDRRFLCERQPGRINFLDPATGEPHASLVMDGIAKDPGIIAFTPDGRRMLSQWDFEDRKPWLVQKWFAKWWPAPTGCFIVSDVATGRVLLRVNIRESGAAALLSDDGRTLMTSMNEGETEAISCWDVPGRPSLWPVIGIPLALACVAVLGRWWFGRKRRVPRPAPVVS